MSGVDLGHESEVWADALHPGSVKDYAASLIQRALRAVLFRTNLAAWDDACDDTGGGLDDYWYVVIGGASNVGKTQLMISLARSGLLQKFAVVIVTMEEPIDQIQRRIYASISELGYYDFTYRNFNDAKAGKLIETVPYLGKLAVNYEMPAYDLNSIVGYLDEARDMLVGRPMVVVLDNLQLVKVERGSSIAEAATEVSEGLRIWAKRNRTLTFALSQVTSEVLRSSRPVRAHDLWGGNAMYSNPSQVLILDHLAKTVDERHPHIVRLWGLLDKNRYGPRMIAMPIEANLKTGEWRCAEPDEHHLWKPNPWTEPNGGRR
jgi:KaiC/GvpD/RAD55 family RecA-like ATPase